jgi:ankyrin repeat protein
MKQQKTIEEAVQQALAKTKPIGPQTFDEFIIPAMRNNKLDVIKQHIDQNNVNIKLNAQKQNLLHIAIACDKIDILEHLLNIGADPNVKDYDEQSPLHYATWGNGCLKAIQLLINKGADVNAVDKHNKTALDHALNKADFDIINQEIVTFLKKRMELQK